MPLTANPPLHLVVLVGSDFRDRDLQSAGAGEAVRRDQGGKIDIAVRKLRIAGYLVQAFTGDQLYRNRMGRRCFRFEEEWSNDSLSSRDDRVMRNLAKVHVVRADSSVDEIRGLEAAGNGNAIRELVRDAVDSYFGRRFADKRYIGVVVLDAIGDLRLPGIKDTSALGGGLGIVGSKGFHSLTTTLEGVTSMFSDCSRIGTDVGTSDSSETGFIWESATVTLGKILEAFVSPQPQIVPRDFGHLNRTFITKEPYSLRSKTPGLSPSMPKDEDTWPRIDCLRMRFHPCFRLPTDPMPLDVPEIPQVFALETGLVASATSGIVLIMVFLDGVFSDFFDFTQKPEREVFLNDRTLRAKIPDLPKASPNVMLRILSAGQGEAIMDDFTAAVNEAKINIPIGHGTVYKSGAYGTLSSNKDSGADHHMIFNSITAGSLLIAIRVYHSLRLNALEFIYEDKSIQLFGTKPKDDSASTEFPIDARRGEILMGFCMRSKGAVRGLEILTSFGRRSDCFGGMPLGGNMTTLIPPKGRALAGVYGSCLDDFAILYK
ncbi:hypothetical protein EX30DRAFT_368951 [Ascodesmis nigricans]|uniref:Jacalin-type lectin domain-containing protein n=1 Tax=Ascodesmis nigricans TaxID=341454 RepID=A0A4S2N377_9PEZI|nr:hypothetical protein EX30DRAFT_368951 [Ascodesmis nigricans]